MPLWTRSISSCPSEALAKFGKLLITQMEENIKRAWKDLVDELRPLDESWPPKLVFIHTPTMASSKYTTCIDPLRPNDGPCALDIDNANNSHFLRIQTLVARNIDLYQEFDTDLAKRFLEDLHTTAIGLEEVKRDHWERGRRLYNFGMRYTRIMGKSTNRILQIQMRSIR